MRRSLATYLAAISAVFLLTFAALPNQKSILAFQQTVPGAPNQQLQNDRQRDESPASFRDNTQEIVRTALVLAERNQREGASLDQCWYAFRRFRDHLEAILTSKRVRFYGGREAEVLHAISNHYISVQPIEPNQDPGEIRLFLAHDKQDVDLIIIGQNSKELALKTAIRLADIFRFMTGKSPRVLPEGLDSFLSKIEIYRSAISARQEFISFFHQYRIIDPDAVIIGFEGDGRAVLRDRGMNEPERYSTDSLRVSWYPDIHGKKVLLVSINGNRIFASRAGEFIRAMIEDFHSLPRSLIFFGSSGAIDSADLVGQIVAPTVVVYDDFRALARPEKQPARVFNNRAAMILSRKSAHVSVESLTMETRSWAKSNRGNGISTVDQELYHIVNALNTSPDSGKIRLFAGLLITDNVASSWTHRERSLKRAEDVLADTRANRRAFLAKVFAEAGVTHDR